MWTAKDIADVVLLLALIASGPFVFTFTIKALSYIFNRYFPRDTIIEIKSKNQKTRLYLVKRKPFGRSKVFELTDKNEVQREITA